MIEITPIVQEKFWIIKDQGVKIGSISKQDDRYLMVNSSTTKLFNSKQDISQELGYDIHWQEIHENLDTEDKLVYGYPVSFTPYNITYDVQRGLPLFTKSENSKSFYCAGYYLIHFKNGSSRGFCPKLVTLETYGYQGPYHSKSQIGKKYE